MRLVDRLQPALVVATLSLGIAVAAAGQVPDTSHRQRATVIGQVVDSGGVGLREAEVMVLADDQPVVNPFETDSQGNFTFRNLPADRSYTFIARKMGYKPARGQNIHVNAGDTLRLRLVLDPLVVVLPQIDVKGRRGHRSSLFADEFATKVKIYRDALTLMTWDRPYMLGDPEFCSPPDSLSRPVMDRPRLRITDRLAFYKSAMGNGSNMGERVYATRKQWLDSLRYGSILNRDLISLPYVRQVYVNGLRVDRPHDPIRTPLRMLSAIPSRYIAEMHYIDCWNTSVPLGMQYSIVVTLKPLSPAQQDTMSRFVLAGAALAGPIEGRVLSIKRPSRETWDSIIRVLTGRDSAMHDSTKARTSP